jgi:hypothetical protein
MKRIVNLNLIIFVSTFLLIQACLIPLTNAENENVSFNANWTIMMYFDGDNKLHDVMELYLMYIREIPYEPTIQLIVLIDGKPDGDTKLYHILENTLVELEWEVESAMDDPGTLEQFIKKAQTDFPANHYGLFIESNKGSAWQGLCYDENGDGTMITMPEFHQVLQSVTNDGTSKIDILTIESCMTGNTELAYEIKNFCDYFIAGPECGIVAPAQGIGLPYQTFITELVSQPEMSPEDLTVLIVENFIPVNEPSTDIKTNLFAIDLSYMDDIALLYDNLAEFLKNNIDNYKSNIYDSLDQTKIFGELWGINYIIEPYQFLEYLLIDDSDYQTIKNQLKSTIESSIVAKIIYPGDSVNSLNLYLPRNTPDYNHALRYESGILPSPYEETQFAIDTRWDEFLKTFLGIAYNTAPNKPSIEGPNEANMGESYDYLFTATDPEEDNLFYYIDWGDGTEKIWYGPYPSNEQITFSHTYVNQGGYTIQAKVKDTSDAESDWSTYPITISKIKNQPFQQIITFLIGKITDIEENQQGGVRFLPIRVMKIVLGGDLAFSIQIIDETYGGYPCCTYINPEDFKGLITSSFIVGCWFT